MFFSTTTNGIDAKGRVSVPADFRSVVAGDRFEGVYVWCSFNGPFLEGGGQALMAEMAAAIDAMDPYDDARTAFERVIFGGARPLSFDQTGRVSLPREFLEHAGLDGKATFVGMGRRFEIWSPDAHLERHARDLEHARQNKGALRRPPHAAGGQ